MRVGVRITRLSSALFPLPPHPPLSPTPRRLRCNLSLSAASPKECGLNEESDKFLRWLRQKAGAEISSALSLGNSIHGRSLFASKNIKAGECIMKVPYTVQLTSENLSLDIKPLLPHDIGNVSQLAVVLLAEKKLGQYSGWATYVNSLPCMDEMHNAIFWSKDELEMIRQSSVYQETISQLAHIKKEYSALRPVLAKFSHVFGEVHLADFMHAYALGMFHEDKEIITSLTIVGNDSIRSFKEQMCHSATSKVDSGLLRQTSIANLPELLMVSSRAWETSKGVSLIPFADFLNHDGTCDAILLSDVDKEISEVIADRDYAVGEQVMIRYGKFSNATLLLDFGFTLSYNIHDQLQLWMDIPSHDPLYEMKTKLLVKHCLPRIRSADKSNSPGNSFIIKQVKSSTGKGKGIPQALRAFARVLSATSVEELQALVAEAAENDGRLARRPLKSKEREIQAHCILCSQFVHMIQGHDAALKVLKSVDATDCNSRQSLRTQMARDLLNGELRVMQAAYAWLTNYCTSLKTCAGKKSHLTSSQ